MKPLKYQADIDSLGCDISYFGEQNIEVFRYVFDDINDMRNFIPQYLRNKRIVRVDCRGWGLSVYNSEESAIVKYQEMLGNRKNLDKKLGTHIAKGNIEVLDGISDAPSGGGHFTHFEYCDIELKDKFDIINEI